MPRQWEVRSGADLGRAIAELRRARGRSQSELASEAGITATYLSKIEGGRTGSLLEKMLRTLRRLGAEVTVTWSEDES